MSEFVLVRYALYAEGELIETNDPEIKPDAKDKPLLIRLGDNVFPKEIEEKLKESDSVELELPPEKSPFGPRRDELVRVYSTKELRRILGRRPKVGDTIRIGNAIGRVIFVDRNRTFVDFNHPLAGKRVKYVVKVIKRIEDDKELLRRLVYNHCDAIKPDEIEFEEGETLVIVLPKGRLNCPGVELAVASSLKKRNKLTEMTRKKPLKPERLESL